MNGHENKSGVSADNISDAKHAKFQESGENRLSSFCKIELKRYLSKYFIQEKASRQAQTKTMKPKVLIEKNSET